MNTNLPKSAALIITPEQGNALLQILDIAAKAAGLQAARECVFFHDKIQEAFKQAQAALDTEKPLVASP